MSFHRYNSTLPPKEGILPFSPLLVAMQSCVSCALTVGICCWTSLTWESGGKILELHFAHFSGEWNWVILNWQSLQRWMAGQGSLPCLGPWVATESVNWSCAHVVPLEKGGMQWQRVLPFCSTVFLKLFIFCCVLDGTCFSSCRLPWDWSSWTSLLSFISTLVLCFYVIMWNVKKETLISSGFMVSLISLNPGSYSGP